jgi:hypothetical protein
MDYKRNKKYFLPSQTGTGIFLLLVGIIGLVAGANIRDAQSYCIGGGLLLIVIGALIIFSGTAGKPSDKEIDEVCRAQISDLRQRALRKLGVDEEEVKLTSPIILDGYSFKNINRQFLYKQGKDSIHRSSNYEAMILFFGENQVHSYKYVFSIIADERLENTDEYFYKDIVTVSTASQKFSIPITKGKPQDINYEQFVLTTSGATRLECNLFDLGGVEKSIQGMRQLLRQKKLA